MLIIGSAALAYLVGGGRRAADRAALASIGVVLALLLVLTIPFLS